MHNHPWHNLVGRHIGLQFGFATEAAALYAGETLCAALASLHKARPREADMARSSAQGICKQFQNYSDSTDNWTI